MSFKAIVTAALVAAASVSAQNSTGMTNSTGMSNSTQYASGLVQALQQANLTTLAGLAAQNAQALLPMLMSGNKTVFAPTNEAFAALPSNVSSNATLVADVLMYHIYYGHFPMMSSGNSSMMGGNSSMMGGNSSMMGNSSTYNDPHMIYRSLLNATDFVKLPGNQSQVGVFTSNSMSMMSGGNMTSMAASNSSSMSGNSSQVTWVGPLQNVTSVATTTYQNLVVHVVPQVLTIPGSLNETAAAANLTALTGALNSYAPGAISMLEEIRGVTLFAPVDSAFQNVTSLIGQLNSTQITDVLLNHVINGTVVYSTEIAKNTTAVSAAGETFSFMEMADGIYVKSGNSTAKIIRADIPIKNGVVHLISSVLANPMANPQAAASAASAYNSMGRTATAVPTGAVGGTATGSGSNAATSGKTTSSAGKVGISAAAGALAVVGMMVAA